MKGKAKWSIFLALVLALSMALSACNGSNNGGGTTTDKSKGGSASGDSNYKQVLNLAETEEIPTLNTTTGDDEVSFNVFATVYEGLYTMNQKDQLVPALAVKDPTIKKVGSDYVYTFQLQPKAKWSNGDPVTAQDFVYAWRKVVDPNSGATYAYLFPILGVKNAAEIMDKNSKLYGKTDQLGVKAIDAHTLQVTLTQQVPFYKSLFGFPTFFPQDQKFVESQGKNYGLEANEAVYNGPYVLSSWEHDQGWTYKKNPNYWDKKNVHIDEINEKVVKDQQARLNLYEGGQIDAVGLTGAEVTKYQNDPDFRKVLHTSVYYIKYNEQNKYLKNVHIRKALNEAWNKEQFVSKLINNGSIVATGLIPKGFYTTADGKDFRAASGNLQSYNLADAKKEWKEGLKELGVKSINLTLLAYDGNDYQKQIIYVVNQLQKNLPGLKLKLNQQEFKVMLDLEQNQNYDMVTAGWGPDYQDPTTFLDMFTTGNGENQMGYSDKQFDQLDKASYADAADPAKRDQDLIKAEQILIKKDQALNLMYQAGGASLVKPYLVNFKTHPFGPDYTFKFMSVKKH